MDVREVRPGLWRWTARHPDWRPEDGGRDGWGPDVGCTYYEADDALVLIDPLIPGDEERQRFLEALDRDVERAGRPVAVLLTVSWHERSAGEVVRRYPGATMWAHGPAVRRLEVPVTNPFDLGDRLPGRIEAYAAGLPSGELLYWLPEARSLVAGDVLIGAENGGVRICPDSWLSGASPAHVRRALRGLLELPVELVLVAHGEPVLEGGRAALAHAHALAA